MDEPLIVAPTGDPTRFRGPDGLLLTPPAGWAFFSAGDAALTRRVRTAGPSWSVVRRQGRRAICQGVWAPAEVIESIRAALAVERADPAHDRRRAADARRRAATQEEYVAEFAGEVLAFLQFAPAFAARAQELADAVTRHATPVGSGTVARTRRIPVDERAEAAVIAWLRHQTTAYDKIQVPKVKGMRRQIRRQLAEVSRRLLDLHRPGGVHPDEGCGLCAALARRAATAAPDQVPGASAFVIGAREGLQDGVPADTMRRRGGAPLP
jgi:hypothetical protein